MRSLIMKHIIGELDWAYSLIQQGRVAVGEPRVDFRVVYEF
ncbi:MAG: hypothetical protein Q8N35_01330 [Methylococcaceae bacterium]|nr:hypothetical protein [Methylococcaceae bacterium]